LRHVFATAHRLLWQGEIEKLTFEQLCYADQFPRPRWRYCLPSTNIQLGYSRQAGQRMIPKSENRFSMIKQKAN